MSQNHRPADYYSSSYSYLRSVLFPISWKTILEKYTGPITCKRLETQDLLSCQNSQKKGKQT